MKKSIFFATLAIFIVVCTLTAGNLKLKREYNAGNIQSAYITKSLPPFSYIKETLSTEVTYRKSLNFYVKPGQNSSVSVFFAVPDVYRYRVINDTLFIDNDGVPKRTDDNTPLYFTCSELKKIIATNGNFSIRDSSTDSLFILATAGSRIDILDGHFKNIAVEASGKSAVNFYGMDTISHASLSFKDSSNLRLSGVVIKEKSLQMEKLTSLLLSGSSIENFGVKRN